MFPSCAPGGWGKKSRSRPDARVKAVKRIPAACAAALPFCGKSRYGKTDKGVGRNANARARRAAEAAVERGDKGLEENPYMDDLN